MEVCPPINGESLMSKINHVKRKTALAIVAGASFVASGAHAALPTEATAAMTAISTGVTDAEGAAWPIIGAAMVAGIIIKLVKRFANKV